MRFSNETLMTILDNLVRTNITVLNATRKPLYKLFTDTAETPLDRMPYYFYFDGYFKETFLPDLQYLNSTQLSQIKVLNKEDLLFPGGGLFMLTWSEYFDYLLGRSSNEDVMIVRDSRIRDEYLKLKMNELFDLQGE